MKVVGSSPTKGAKIIIKITCMYLGDTLYLNSLKESHMLRINLLNNITGFGYDAHRRFGDSFLSGFVVSGPVCFLGGNHE